MRQERVKGWLVELSRWRPYRTVAGLMEMLRSRTWSGPARNGV